MVVKKKTLQKILADKEGQTIVEFAIIFPLFMFIFIGFVYMGMVFHDYLAITYFTREAARSSVVGTTKAAITTDATTNHRLSLTNLYTVDLTSTADFDIVQKKDDNLGGDFVTVTVTARKNTDRSLAIIDGCLPATLTSSLYMRVETNAGT